jgi:glycosyltransferase involved in cell wall biosynthesis
MMMSTGVTVVVPAYGPGPHLRSVIAALQRQAPPVEGIIISHSGEGDPTARLAGTGVSVLHSERRLFAGAARNRGVGLAETEWVAFIDEDVIPDDRWHAALLDSIARGDADCIAGSVGYAESGGYWGISLWFSEFSSFHPYLPGRRISSGGSGNLAVRRELFLVVGGFPEDWRTGEELLTQARLEERGLAIRFEPQVIGRHVNLPGMRRMLRHAYPLGRGSAKVRRECPHLVGAWALRWPILSLGLWIARMGQIYWRVLSARGGPVSSLVLHTPGVLMAVVAWNLGFAREAFRCPRPPGTA